MATEFFPRREESASLKRLSDEASVRCRASAAKDHEREEESETHQDASEGQQHAGADPLRRRSAGRLKVDAGSRLGGLGLHLEFARSNRNGREKLERRIRFEGRLQRRS